MSTHAGLKLVTVDDYMSRVVLDRPKYVVAIADEISHVTSTDKRKLASMFRTLEWFKKMCKYENKLSEKWEHTDISLFGVVLPYQTVEGGSKKDKDFSDIVTKKISEMVNTYLDSGASGICVGGLGMGENHVVRRSAIENVRRIIDIRATSTPGTVSEPVPIMVQGMNSLNEILEAIDAGVDVVASNYPSIVTSLGHGIHWNLRKSVESEDEVLRIEDGIINLWDAKYEEDPSPLVSICELLH